MSQFIRSQIIHDYDERGQLGWLVVSWYRLDNGTIVSIPPSSGWPTKAEAEAEANAESINN